jgi:hypothetical protein
MSRFIPSANLWNDRFQISTFFRFTPGSKATTVSATFIVKFNEHLSAQQVSNLKGILLFNGLAREMAADFTFSVYREHRIQLTAQNLNNWVACGWVSSWASEPPLMKD